MKLGTEILCLVILLAQSQVCIAADYEHSRKTVVSRNTAAQNDGERMMHKIGDQMNDAGRAMKQGFENIQQSANQNQRPNAHNQNQQTASHNTQDEFGRVFNALGKKAEKASKQIANSVKSTNKGAAPIFNAAPAGDNFSLLPNHKANGPVMTDHHPVAHQNQPFKFKAPTQSDMQNGFKKMGDNLNKAGRNLKKSIAGLSKPQDTRNNRHKPVSM